jgi:hydroxymethylpyrimidine/phosphomethylpyrimidine kinase
MNSHSLPLPPPIVLTFAASDPSGGAGMQADLMTLSSIGCHPLSVATALTVQDTVGVSSILAVDADCVENQARTLLEDMPVAAFKMGLLGSIENIAVIAEILADYPNIPLILDPVLASGRGDELVDEEMIAGLCELLMPLTTILTPNSLEARRLLDGDMDDEGDDEQRTLVECAQSLLDLGCEYVLLTGTHENTARVVNSLYGRRLGLVRSDPGIACPAATTVRVVRSPRRLPPIWRGAGRWSKRWWLPRNIPGNRWPPAFGREWVNSSRIASSRSAAIAVL